MWGLKCYGLKNFFTKIRCHVDCKSFASMSEGELNIANDENCGKEEKVHFGFSQIPRVQKRNLVEQVFSNVASKYDLMNDVMSMGVHRLWKDEFVNVLQPKSGIRIIDVAGGTGDIAYRIVERIEKVHERTKKSSSIVDSNDNRLIIPEDCQTDLVVYDINLDMLEQGKMKERDHNKLGLVNMQWVKGDAEDMPYEDNTFDAYTIAFGIRNCTDIQKVLSEAHRILKPKGRFLCLEFSEVKSPILSNIYDIYSFDIIPLLGKLIVNDSQSYQYLIESIRQFPDQDQFKLMIEDTGFKSVSYRELSFGIASIYSGFK